MDLHTVWNSIGHPRILVLGDLMLDRYTWGDAERVSPEAPVIVLRADQEEVRPGGAASVAYLLRHLEAEVSIAGVVGDDSDGRTLRALMQDEGIEDLSLLVDPARPTTVKHRFVGRASDRHPHQILRVDHESRVPLSCDLETQLSSTVQERIANSDAILIADYAKGACTPSLVRQVIATARAHQRPVLIDPGRLPDYDHYRGATVLKPNRVEAEFLCGRAIPSSEAAAEEVSRLCDHLNVDSAVITLDREGLVVGTEHWSERISCEPRTVYDITGAGDMVLAALGLCVAGGIDLSDSARLANAAAGLEVERFGIAPVNREEISAKLSSTMGKSTSKLVATDEVARLAAAYRQQGKRIVFTNGCFDLLHVGHVSYLQEAATLGDVLIVGVNSDSSVRRLKGPTRPVVSELDRATMLASLGCVHHVVIFTEDTPHDLLSRVRPDLLVKGGTTQTVVGREIVEHYGGEVRLLPEIAGVSTTRLIEVATRLSSERLSVQ